MNQKKQAVDEEDQEAEIIVVLPIDGVLDLHTFSPREVDNLVDDYIEACLQASIFDIRIIHGKGKGILRKRLYGILARHPLVESFKPAPLERGGWGAVLVRLKPCPFCNIAPDRIIMTTARAMAITDSYPVSRGHCLIVPRKHVTSLFALGPAEQAELWALVSKVRDHLLEEFQPDAFTIGLNDGAAAGQTIGHAHVHVIPRWLGDVLDPRGGVRWIIPDKAVYWKD